MSVQAKAKKNKALSGLLNSAIELPIEARSRILVISDLHMGDGGKNDDFKKNAQVLFAALERFYLPNGYTLILNGDIEELLRTEHREIAKQWALFFRLLKAFESKGRLYRTIGNHELLGDFAERDILEPKATDALRLTWHGHSIFVFHGHQAGVVNSGRYNRLIGFFLRVFANRLHISNYTVAASSDKKIKIEKTVYDFSLAKGIVSLIGHTHRPLFESLSKYEDYGYKIESLCRSYAGAGETQREGIRKSIRFYKEGYDRAQNEKKDKHNLANLVYGKILVPCIFNSGCGIGKRGLSAIEIRDDWIQLVFWSDAERAEPYNSSGEYKAKAISGNAYYRFMFRKEKIEYIFSRIDLLR